MRDPDYCSFCYTAAKKHGRPVRQTDAYEFPLCALCENRAREGLIHYVPSNGTEAMIFEERCERCRHLTRTPDGCGTCAWGILDRLLDSAWTDSDSDKRWYQPEEISTRDADGGLICPAECRRFTDRNDKDGETRDPMPKDCIGQMLFGDVDVPRATHVKHPPMNLATLDHLRSRLHPDRHEPTLAIFYLHEWRRI